jgi:hypothetical protein
MQLSSEILRNRNRWSFYSTTITALQPSNSGGEVQRSFRTFPSRLVQTGLLRATHDGGAIIQTLSQPESSDGAGDGSFIAGAGAGIGGLVRSESSRAMWDEDEVMLFFWGNSQAAKERHRKKFGENTRAYGAVEGRRASNFGLTRNRLTSLASLLLWGKTLVQRFERSICFILFPDFEPWYCLLFPCL